MHTMGRRGSPKSAQPLSGVSWMQRVSAGLPVGMPGIGVEIDGAVQHAPQRGRQSMGGLSRRSAIAGIAGTQRARGRACARSPQE
jgi:oxygen-independent coproporphyrinogen-3 oxidase